MDKTGKVTMTAKQVRASKIKGWIKQFGTINAIIKVRDASNDTITACRQRVLSLQKLWRDKGCEVVHVNTKVWS
jgi:hypothetical protein